MKSGIQPYSREWSPGAGGFGPDDVGVTSLMTLNFMWFKFAVIWRFFRLWALMSGVEAGLDTNFHRVIVVRQNTS